MSTVRNRANENVIGIFSLLILGAGFVALFANVDYFWLIWVFGFAVFLPLIAILTGKNEDELAKTSFEHDTRSPDEHSGVNTGSTSDAVATLRDRYARSELTDEQFERKLDELAETDHPTEATKRHTR